MNARLDTELRGWLANGTLRVREGRVQMLRPHRCSSCGHRHVSTYRSCEENITALCFDCGDWPSVAECQRFAEGSP